MLFESDLYPRAEASAKLVLYMLRRAGAAVEAASGQTENGAVEVGAGEGRHEVLGNLVQLARLLEQYYHPSNNGA